MNRLGPGTKGGAAAFMAAGVAAAILCPPGGVPAHAADNLVVPQAGVGVTAPAAANDPLTVEVLTFGPGDHPFTKFGHNAIRVTDRQAGTDWVYNFGTFSFHSPRLIVDFLKGRLRYWLSRSSMTSAVHSYQRDNRSIEAQELDLLPAQKRELARRLEVNARPENREYRYDYFGDNCSTRVRDALDGVLGGRLRASAVGQGTMSFRAHALRMAADNLSLYTALLIVLGPRADRPIDEWAEGFLPEMLQRTLRGALAGDGTGGSSSGRLVKAERVVFAPQRPPPLREPPSRLPGFLVVGLILGLIMAGLGRVGSSVPAARFAFGVLVSVTGLVLGGVGCFLVGAWALTPHAVVYRNENVLLFAPFAIALVVLGIGSAIGRPGARRKTYLVAASALGLAIAACGLKLFPWSRQDNGALILLLVPTWLGITIGARAIAGPDGRPRSRSRGYRQPSMIVP
jgi:hypothetical protein